MGVHGLTSVDEESRLQLRQEALTLCRGVLSPMVIPSVFCKVIFAAGKQKSSHSDAPLSHLEVSRQSEGHLQTICTHEYILLTILTDAR